MYLLVKLIEHGDILKIQVTNFTYTGFITENSPYPILAVPHHIDQKLRVFLQDRFVLFDPTTCKVMSINKLRLLLLPKVEPLTSLHKIIFDISTISM